MGPRRSRAGGSDVVATPLVHLDPALELWRRELAKGARTIHTFDTLWMAACWEQAARDLDTQGSIESAARCRATARELIRRARAAA